MKKRTVILLVAGLIILILVFRAGIRTHVRDLPEILEEGRLSVLIESGEHGFTRDSLKVYGFQYELIRLFSDSLGVELLVSNQANTKDGVSELSKGKCDVLVSLRPLMTDSVKSVVSLTPILTTRLMLVQQRDSVGRKVIRRQYELDGERIVVMQSSPYITRLQYLAEEVAIDLKTEEVATACLDDIIKMVDEGRFLYTVCPEYLAERFKKRYPDLDFSLPLSFHFDLSWKVNEKSPELRARLNKFLEEIVGYPDFQELYNKYFL